MGEGEALDLIRDRLRTHTSWRAFVATGHQDADIPTDGTSRGGSTVDGAWPPARLARLRLRVRAILHDPSLQTPGFEPRGEDVYHTAEDDEEDWERARASGALDALLGRETTATATAATGPPRAMGEPSGPTHPPPGHHDARGEGPPGHASPPHVPSLDGCVHGVSKESPESARDPASSRASPGGTEGADSGGGGSGGGETSPPGHEQGKKQLGEDIEKRVEDTRAVTAEKAEAIVLGSNPIQSNPTEAAVAAFRRHRTNTCESNKDGWTDPTDAEWRERTLVTRLRVAAARRDRGGDRGRVKPPPARTPEGMRDYVAASSTPGFCPERWDVSSVVPALPGGWDEFAGHAVGETRADGGADTAVRDTAVRGDRFFARAVTKNDALRMWRRAAAEIASTSGKEDTVGASSGGCVIAGFDEATATALAEVAAGYVMDIGRKIRVALDERAAADRRGLDRRRTPREGSRGLSTHAAVLRCVEATGATTLRGLREYAANGTLEPSRVLAKVLKRGNGGGGDGAGGDGGGAAWDARGIVDATPTWVKSGDGGSMGGSPMDGLTNKSETSSPPGFQLSQQQLAALRQQFRAKGLEPSGADVQRYQHVLHQQMTHRAQPVQAQPVQQQQPVTGTQSRGMPPGTHRLNVGSAAPAPAAQGLKRSASGGAVGLSRAKSPAERSQDYLRELQRQHQMGRMMPPQEYLQQQQQRQQQPPRQ